MGGWESLVTRVSGSFSAVQLYVCAEGHIDFRVSHPRTDRTDKGSVAFAVDFKLSQAERRLSSPHMPVLYILSLME